jgi:hypothetical protein
MMGVVRTLVVLEAMSGNTKVIADAVVLGLSFRLDVDLVEVGAAPTEVGDKVGLLVVGGRTHAFGLREWLAEVRPGAANVAAATFDTRGRRPHLPGSAAAAAARRLRRLGFHVVARPESFYVAGDAGPVLGGEPERARRWAEGLGSAVAVAARGRRVF